MVFLRVGLTAALCGLATAAAAADNKKEAASSEEAEVEVGKGYCPPGLCKHGDRVDGLFGPCVCKPLWEGDCCDEAKCDDISNNLAKNVSLSEWVRATWYVQAQQVTAYQPNNSLNCVLATYNMEGATVPAVFPGRPPFWDGTVVSVYNYANEGRVNGAPLEAANTTLCARVPDDKDPSKLLVAPCFLPNWAAGPYWILSVGENKETGHYDWAIVIAGQPYEPYVDGCTTTTQGINGAGLWLFSREQVASQETMDLMLDELKAKGITSKMLLQVRQEGCTYDGALRKT
eukprot:TRINITY_DN5406_c0_g1_i1.p1 TRINITY_DN5406_c0_g1~~TRINITY_DN5406_c0_g1_i1.p1  ORF type:complete len:288 (+),score=66.77 TRINITY_DN5406_c0_g1_i1:84-947(+)